MFWHKFGKICQVQTRSTKGTPSINLQAPLAKTVHETPSPKVEGAAVSRLMAFSITTQQQNDLKLKKSRRRTCFRIRLSTGGPCVTARFRVPKRGGSIITLVVGDENSFAGD